MKMQKLVSLVMVFVVSTLTGGAFADVYHFHESFDSAAWKTRPEYKGTTYTKGGAYTYMVENYTADDGDGDLGALEYYANENLKYELVYHDYEFSQAGYLLSNPVVKLDGFSNKGYGYGFIYLSVWDGSNWQTIYSTDNGNVTLTMDFTGDSAYQNIDILKVRIGARVDYHHSWPDARHDWLDVQSDLTPIPEPATIGLLVLALEVLRRRH